MIAMGGGADCHRVPNDTFTRLLQKREGSRYHLGWGKVHRAVLAFIGDGKGLGGGVGDSKGGGNDRLHQEKALGYTVCYRQA
jgi:hypothetical protein